MENTSFHLRYVEYQTVIIYQSYVITLFFTFIFEPIIIIIARNFDKLQLSDIQQMILVLSTLNSFSFPKIYEVKKFQVFSSWVNFGL